MFNNLKMATQYLYRIRYFLKPLDGGLVLISSAGDPALYSAPAKNVTAFTFTKLSVSSVVAVDSLRGVSYDPVDKKVYWVEKSISGKVRRADLDGSNSEDVATGVNSKNLKVHF